MNTHPQFIRRCHPCTRKSHSQAVLSRMQLTLHETRRTPHGASRLVLAMSAWSVKTRCAPSRHCRDARVYDHATTAMHDNEHTPRSAGEGGNIAGVGSMYKIAKVIATVTVSLSRCPLNHTIEAYELAAIHCPDYRRCTPRIYMFQDR